MKQSPFSSPMKLKGKLLLASPSLEDPFFQRTVILITEHTPKKGAKGFILNKPANNTIGKAAPDLTDIPPELTNLEIFIGGPVEKNNLSMSAFTCKGEQLLYKAEINREETLALIQTPGTLIRSFAGYSSWVPGQLENELSENSWIILPALCQLLGMEHDHSLWKALLERTSPMHFLLSRSPLHPYLN